MRREWTIYLALWLLTAAVYWPVSQFGYVNFDDPDYASANPHIQQGLTPAGVAWAFRAVVASNWHPVTLLSLMLDCQLFGNSAGAHHLVNLLFHIANTLLLFLVWRRMTGEVWPSALVAALFAWHPLHVESVAWISERKDVLSAFFGLLTLWAYIRYAKAQAARSQPPETLPERHAFALRLSPRSRFYFLALLCFALSLMSKPMLVTWPFVLLLLDFWPLGRFGTDDSRIANFRFFSSLATRHLSLFLEKLPFFALAAAAGVITFLVQRTAGTMIPLTSLPISLRVDNVFVSYVRYLVKMFWPAHLASFYPYPGPWLVHSEVWTVWQVAGAALLLALITIAAVWQARRRPFLIVGWLWFLGTLVPVIGLVQVGAQAMADRYTYIPLIGGFVMIGWLGKELVSRRPDLKFPGHAAMAAALAACLVLTGRQLRYWRNSEALWRHDIAVTTNNFRAYFGLGEALVEEGKTDAGIRQMYRAMAIMPRFTSRRKLADYLVRQGSIPAAIEQYRDLLQYEPDQPEALNNLAWLLATDEDPKLRAGAEAVRLARRACDLTHYQTPSFVGTLAAAYAETGQFDDAVQMAKKAIALASASGETNLLELNRQLLELYRAGHPYHETTKL